MKQLVLAFKGSNQDFGKFLDFLDEYLEWNPGATLGDLASNEVLDLH